MKDNDNRKKYRKDSLQNKNNKKSYNDEDTYYANRAKKQFKNKKQHLLDEDSLEELEDYQ
jgi:hypothetical protein